MKHNVDVIELSRIFFRKSIFVRISIVILSLLDFSYFQTISVIEKKSQ